MYWSVYDRDMDGPDLNLLVTLDVLLAEGSVTRAAARLHLSPSAMSRTLARLRETTGDPLLVRAGRGLVPTPRATELRELVGPVVAAASALLGPATGLDPARLVRTFTLRTSEGFVENFGPALLAHIGREAPGVRLRFVPKPGKDSRPLRDGLVDLETGVVGSTTGPEVRAQKLFGDRFVGVVRQDHPLCRGRVTLKRYAAARHIIVARRRGDEGPVADGLRSLGIERNIAVTVSGFATALVLASADDLVATVPERHTGILREGLCTFALPFPVAEITVSLLWHPRMEADPAHRWLRACVREVCGRNEPAPALPTSG